MIEISQKRNRKSIFERKGIVMRKFSLLILVVLVGFILSIGSFAAEFPSKPITIILPWSQGAGTDIQVRAIAKVAEKTLGQSILVENKIGGGGSIGLLQGIMAKADGYTVTTLSIPLNIIPYLQEVPDYFRYDSFKPVLRYNLAPGTITVRSDSPWKTFNDFLEYAKANPNKIRIGTAPPGGAFNFVTARLIKTLDIEAVQIPYGGSGPAVAALMGGHVEATTFSPDSVLPQVQSGEFRVLAVLGKQRSAILPDVPTLGEFGYNLECGTWRGFGVPKDTPDSIVKILHDEFKKAIETEEIQSIFKRMGVSVDYLGLDDFGKFLADEYNTVGELVKDMGLGRQ